MSYEVFTIPAFDKAVKRLRRKYRRYQAKTQQGIEAMTGAVLERAFRGEL